MALNFITPENLFDNHYPPILDLVADQSPFPRAKSDLFSKASKMKAARIHLAETVFFGQVVFHDLEPKKTVEVCAGFAIPSITLKKLFGVTSICVDKDSAKMAVGALISQKLGINLIWEHRDIFLYLRHHAQKLRGATLLATAAYCQDKKRGRPKGSGEKDFVLFAQKNQMDIALLPYRTGDIISTGFSSEKKRIEEYEEILTNAGYKVKKHSTELLFRGQGAPNWFFIDILTAKYRCDAVHL
jgi:hypothetical protein